MRNVIVDLGFSVARVTVQSGSICLTLMSPGDNDDGFHLPATSVQAYLSFAQAKALAAALTDPVTDDF